jgi:UDP-glucose 4-epimerase
MNNYSLTGKTVLVTGGSGFIGREVLSQLRQHDKTVHLRAFDIRPAEEAGVESVIGSILDRTSLRNAMHGVNYVIHLAAWLGVDASDKQPLKCLDINIEGTMRVLEAAAMQGVQKVLFSSSSEVYGDSNELPILETTPLNPKSVYAVTKLAGEEYVRGFSAQYGIPYSIVRFFNVYGPRQDLRFAVPRFVQTILEKQAPVIFGDGSQTRAFCHVSDAARGIVLAVVNGAADGDLFNIGNPDGYTSILELCRRISRLAGSDIAPRVAGFSSDTRIESREIIRRKPSIEKAQTKIGYTPTVTLDAGLESVLALRRSLISSRRG